MRIAVLDPCRFQKAHHYSEENIVAIAADLTEGSKAIHNPVHVIPKGGGRWEIVAGHDRVEAAKRAGMVEVPHRDFGAVLLTAEQIYEHWRRDNVLRKQPDRMQAAEECLMDWAGGWSDRRVATCCGVSPSTVAAIRKRLEADGQVSKLDTRTDARGRSQPSTKPRQVRGNVPSGRTIPHPTAKVPSGDERKGAPELTGDSTDELNLRGSQPQVAPEVGAPTGAETSGAIASRPQATAESGGSGAGVPADARSLETDSEKTDPELGPIVPELGAVPVSQKVSGTGDLASEANSANSAINPAVVVGVEDAAVISLVELATLAPAKIVNAPVIRSLLLRRPDAQLATLKANIRALQGAVLQWEIAIKERNSQEVAA